MATTSGFVHQAWLLAGPTGCFWVGDDVDSSDLLTVAVAAGDSVSDTALKTSLMAALVDAAAGGQRVDVAHPDDSAAVTAVTYPLESIQARPVQLEGIEVTQTVQDVSHAVPLVAGKATVVRVYLSNHGASSLTVVGEIALRKHPDDPPVLVPSVAAVVLDPAAAGDLAAVRNDAARSLNFVVPATLTSEGPLRVTVTAVATVGGSAVTVGGLRRPTVWFHRSPPLRVRVYGVRYTQGGVTHAPRDLDFELLLSWLARVYPVGQVHSTRVLISADATPPFGCGDINAQVAALRALDIDAGEDQRTHYYALVADSGFFMRGCASGVPVNVVAPHTVASGPTGPGSFGWDFDGSYGDWYGGHELGHTFGRKHPGYCGESADDLANYPYPAGHIGGDDVSFMGFDVGDPALGLPMRALPGTLWTDVMTYCAFEWMSAYTYQGIRKRLADEDNLGSSPSGAGGSGSFTTSGSGGQPDNRFPQARPQLAAAREASSEPTAEPGFVSVVAQVNLTRRRGRIRYVNPVGAARPLGEGPTVELRVTDDGGGELATHAVPVRLDSDHEPGADERGLVDAVVSVPPGATTVHLVIDGDVVDTFRAGTEVADVRALRASPSGADELRVQADASGGSPGQTYFAQTSTDGGHSWATVAVGLTEPDFTLVRSQYEAGKPVLVRVVATNGFTRSVVSETVMM